LNFAKGNALIKLRRFEEGSQFLEKLLNETDESSKEWFVFAEKYIMLNIQQNAFQKASEAFLRVAGNKAFQTLEQQDSEKWNVLRGYIYHLHGDKKIIKKFDYD